jgi:glycosyltransferase involved in cell wall biosynthesis
MPHQVVRDRQRLNVNFTMFEACRIPTRWVEHGLNHDLIIVPTVSCRDAWLASGFPRDRLRISPLGVDGERFRPGLDPIPVTDRCGQTVSGYRVRVLNVSELVPRKNLLALLRTWIRVTRREDDAVLILKLTCAQPDRLLGLLRGLAAIERDLGKARAAAAPIIFLDRTLPESDMPRLYAAATYYWSMSCGEGWDLAMCEAGACGLQLLAPCHSAYTTYLDDRLAWMIPSRQVAAETGDHPDVLSLFAGVDWWEPDEASAGELIRHIIDNPIAARGGARDWLVSQFSWPLAASRLLEILRELHGRHGYSF